MGILKATAVCTCSDMSFALGVLKIEAEEYASKHWEGKMKRAIHFAAICSIKKTNQRDRRNRSQESPKLSKAPSKGWTKHRNHINHNQKGNEMNEKAWKDWKGVLFLQKSMSCGKVFLRSKSARLEFSLLQINVGTFPCKMESNQTKTHPKAENGKARLDKVSKPYWQVLVAFILVEFIAELVNGWWRFQVWTSHLVIVGLTTGAMPFAPFYTCT